MDFELELAYLDSCCLASNTTLSRRKEARSGKSLSFHGLR